MTATNGRPRNRAKYASETAVEPVDASTIVVPAVIQPLHRPYRKSERASRCLSDPVGCTDSSFRYRSMPHSSGSGKACRCVSADRLASASMRRTASFAHARGSRGSRGRPFGDVVTRAVSPIPLARTARYDAKTVSQSLLTLTTVQSSFAACSSAFSEPPV